MKWNHATIPYHDLFVHRKEAYHQFLKDFPRQTIRIHGHRMQSIHEYLGYLQQHVHPSLHIPLIQLSTQASMAAPFALLQLQYPFLSGSTQGIVNDQLVFHYVVTNPCCVQVIIEKNFGVVEFLGDSPCITHILRSFTTVHVQQNWMSDFSVSWKRQKNLQ